MTMMKVTIEQAQPLLVRLLKAGVVPMLHGKPGVGKSAIGQWVADKFKLLLIDIRLAETEPTEIQGFPRINDSGKYAEYIPLDIFPTVDTPIPEGYKGWLILLDEFRSAPKAVQSAAYKLVLDKKVGQRPLHPNVLMMAAGNLDTDGAIVEPQSSALTSRMAHFELVEDAKEWSAWAAGQGIDHRITSYLQFKPGMLHTLNADLPDQPYACPRTWAKLSPAIIGTPITNEDLPLVASLVGEPIAREFKAYCEIFTDLPKLSDIVRDPANAPLSRRLDIQWAMMGSICHAVTESSLEPCTQYLDRFPAELRVVAMKEMFKRHPELYTTEVAQDWLNRTAAEVF